MIVINNRKDRLKKQKKSNLLKNILAIFIILIIGVSTFLYFNPPAKILLSDDKLYDLPLDTDISDDGNNDNPLDASPENILKAQYEDVGAVGQIVIPQQNVAISLPILSGIGNYNMLVGAGEQMSRDVVKPGGNGNYILASHHTEWQDLLFTNLSKINLGSDIYIADENNIYVYRVHNTTKTHINNTTYLDQPTDPNIKMITLYTCEYYGSSNRWIVQGELISTIPIDNIDNDTKVAFDYWLTLIGKV